MSNESEEDVKISSENSIDSQSETNFKGKIDKSGQNHRTFPMKKPKKQKIQEGFVQHDHLHPGVDVLSKKPKNTPRGKNIVKPNYWIFLVSEISVLTQNSFQVVFSCRTNKSKLWIIRNKKG